MVTARKTRGGREKKHEGKTGGRCSTHETTKPRKRHATAPEIRVPSVQY